MHVQVYFTEANKFQRYPTNYEYKAVMIYLEKITALVDKRFFFLFEPDPDLFLALEVPFLKQRGLANRIKEIPIPYLIRDIDFRFRTKDLDHMTDLFYAGARYAFYRAKHKIEGYEGSPEKIIHCLLNQWSINKHNETMFYKRRFMEGTVKHD